MIVVLLSLTALVGLVLTAFGLPGVWVFLVTAMIFTMFATAGAPGWVALGVGTALAVVGEVVEWIASVRWTDRYGGSRRAGWGALAGGLIGAVVGLPVPLVGSILGSFAGAFAGALAGEYSASRDHGRAGRVAWGALMGRVVATAVKMALSVIIAILIIWSALH